MIRLSSHWFTLPATFLFTASWLLADSFPADIDATRFSGADLTPCPACLCVSATGEVYAGVDLNGSLGTGPGKGRIVKLIDKDKDGVADSHTVFAHIDNARGLIAIGDKLYVLHTAFGTDGVTTGMNLAVLEDKDQDGVADGPGKVLVEGICSQKILSTRGTDHSTNGIRMGIDGWIYIAVGDFGFHNATGTDGTQLTLLGGGVARVRPDGTELEMYTTGTRNIYDVAIDPFMNCYTRGNTNDGGGWNVRFLHHLQTGEYGYPRLFKNFSTEIIPALEDLGGGSGVGSLFLSEPTWPEKYNNQPLMADWGRNAIYLHRLSPDSASFTQKAEPLMEIAQVTDLDVDPSGQMFASAWEGAGFKGNDSKGYLVRLTPKGWKPAEFPKTSSMDATALVDLIKSDSATTRFYAQQEILNRPVDPVTVLPLLDSLIQQKSLSLESRIAALFTLAQIETNPTKLLAYAKDEALVEFVMRAATDRLPRLKNTTLPLDPFIHVLQTGTPRQQAAAVVALGQIGNPAAAKTLLDIPFTKPADSSDSQVTDSFTLKGGRKADLLLDVIPGNELRLHLSSIQKSNDPAAELIGAAFTLASGEIVKLSTLQPDSGTAEVRDGKGSGKKSKRGAVIQVSGTAPIVYKVPAEAVSFSATAHPAEARETELYASTGKAGGTIGAPSAQRHATPNPSILIPHLAARALVRMQAADACLAAIGSSSEDLALWALSSMHTEQVVDGLLAKLKQTTTRESREKLLTTLARLYHEEAPFDGTTWWTTRPDTRGPYYSPIAWAASPRIAAALEAEAADTELADFLARLNDSHRLDLEKLGTRQTEETMVKPPTVDLAKIASQQGAVATTPIEDVILAMDKLKPNNQRGEQLFTQQGCVACHSLEADGPALGPFMGQIGSIMTPDQIATAILRPSDSISQGFQSIMLTMKDGSFRTGFASETTADKIVLRDPAGAVSTVATADVKEEKHINVSMMPEGLANSLSLDDFAALVHFLASKK